MLDHLDQQHYVIYGPVKFINGTAHRDAIEVPSDLSAVAVDVQTVDISEAELIAEQSQERSRPAAEVENTQGATVAEPVGQATRIRVHTDTEVRLAADSVRLESPIVGVIVTV